MNGACSTRAVTWIIVGKVSQHIARARANPRLPLREVSLKIKSESLNLRLQNLFHNEEVLLDSIRYIAALESLVGESGEEEMGGVVVTATASLTSQLLVDN